MSTPIMTESEVKRLHADGVITDAEAIEAYDQIAVHAPKNQQVLESVQVDNILAFSQVESVKDFTSKKGCLEGLLEAYKSESDQGRWVLPLGRFIRTYESWTVNDQREALQIIKSTTACNVDLTTVSSGRQGLLAVFYANRPDLTARPDGKTSQAEKRFSFYVSEWYKHDLMLQEKAKNAVLAAKLASGEITEDEYHPTFNAQDEEAEVTARTATQIMWSLYNSHAFKGTIIDKAGIERHMRDVLMAAFKEPAVTIFKSPAQLKKALDTCREIFPMPKVRKEK